MTTMTVKLSAALRAELQAAPHTTNKIYAYAVNYVNGLASNYVTLVENGSVKVPDSGLTLDLQTSTTGQREYIIIQRDGDGKLPSNLQWSTSGNDNLISPSSSGQYNFQYTLLESSANAIGQQANDVTDISAIGTFGIPVSAQVTYQDGTTDPRGFKGSAKDIFDAAKTANPDAVKYFNDGVTPRVVLGTGASGSENPWKPTDWQLYVSKAQTNLSALDMKMAVAASGELNVYGVTYENGYFVLKPDSTFNGVPDVNKDYIRMTSSELQRGIYNQVGSVETSSDGGRSWRERGEFTPNDADGAVVKLFVEGFAAGYWGASASSPNPLDPTAIPSGQKYADNLNKTWNWNFNNAYGAVANERLSTIKYDNILGSGAGTATGMDRFVDPWAQKLAQVFNGYGWPYSDQVALGGVPPTLKLYDARALQDVSTFTVTAFSHTETPSSGYKQPSIGYIPGSFSPVDTADTSGNVFVLNFKVNDYAPSDKTHAWFRIYVGKDEAHPDGFQSIPIPKYHNSQNGQVGIWNNLYVTGSRESGWKLADFPAGETPPSGYNPHAATGIININNVPTASDGTSWYQLQFGDGPHQTVYNIYQTGPQAHPTQFVVDHGVSITPNPSLFNQPTLSFSASGFFLYDPATLFAPGHIRGTEGDDALVGTPEEDTFYTSGGTDTVDGGAGNDTAVYWPSANNYTLRAIAGSPSITIQDKVDGDGTVRWTGVESIEFRDRTIDVTSILKVASLPAAQIMKVVDLYTAGLNRAPDALGLDYYAARLADGASINDIAKAIFSSSEAAPIYSAANSNATLVNLVYQTAFGHAPDAAGAAYWVNELNTGHIQRTDLVTALVAAVRASGGNTADAQYVANKEAVGAHFALTQGLNDINSARSVESAVNGTAASVTAANAQTDALAATAATAAGSELVVQIVGLVP